MKRILLAFVLVTFLSAPTWSVPELFELESMEQIDGDVSITMEGNTVIVSGAQGMTLEIISLTGRRVAQYTIESPLQRIELNVGKGCYVLKVGKVVRKVAIR